MIYEVFVDPFSLTTEVGLINQFTTTQTEQNCYGTLFGPYLGYADQWNSFNPGVATIDFTGNSEAVGVGDTNIEGCVERTIWYNWGGGYCEPFTDLLCDEAPMEVEPTITISGPQSVQDGSFIDPTFTLTAQGDNPTSYQWSWTAPAGSGNNPLVTFSPTNQATTITNRHWFAFPNVACPSPPSVSFPPVSTDPYYNSVYTITGRANFSGGLSPSENTTLTVNAFWGPAGTTAPPVISGGPTIGFDTSRNLWVVVNAGTITRNTPVVTIHVPVNSQFRNKTVVHENRHVQQYQTGMNSDLFTIASLMSELSPLTDPTQAGLNAKIAQKFNEWHVSQLAWVNIRRSAAEQDAHSVSDPVLPQYAYQLCQ